VRQIDENCQSNSMANGGASSDQIGDFRPATIESCPKASDQPHSGSVSAISEEVIRIQSPKFGLITNLGYEPFLDCDYVIGKTSPAVCALEIRFEAFALEESRSCAKDYLEVNGNAGMRMCGRLPSDTMSKSLKK
jgi:hypothetical protein